MKAFPILSAVLIIYLVTACQEEKVNQGETIGSLHISKTYPMPGDSIGISYKAKDSTGKAPMAYFNYLVDDTYYPKDIELSSEDGKWKGSFMVPDSAMALIYNFEMDNEPDTNDKKGYSQLLYTPEEKPLIGSRASLGYYNMTAGERFGTEIEKDSSLALMKGDLDENAPLMEQWDAKYLWYLNKQDSEKAEKLISERIKAYHSKGTLSEKEYGNLASFYGILGNETAGDSIRNIAMKKFPKGKAAEREVLSKLFKEEDVEKQKILVEEFKQTFGEDSRHVSMMSNMLARNYSANGDFENFTKYAEQITEEFQKAGLYNNVAWGLVEKGGDLEYAGKTSKKSLEIVKSLQNDPETKPDELSRKQYENRLKWSYLMYIDTYASILFKQGKKEEALKYQKEALGEKKMGRPDVNERYVQLLLANGKSDEAVKEASRFITSNTSTKKLKEYLQEAYATSKGSEDGYEAYLEGLEKEANKEALAEIKSKIIDEESHDFTLRNLEGEEFTLSELKGKTVILDFWATWCGPCKDSFPGMQMAVDKYKDDPKVAFLFIDTWERGTPEERKKLVTDFIGANKYSFNVLYDNPVKEGSRNFVTTDKYGINGIPTKIILGPDGNIKYKAVGNMGSGEQLVNELDIIIGLLQS